jgi:hypothetical protein
VTTAVLLVLAVGLTVGGGLVLTALVRADGRAERVTGRRAAERAARRDATARDDNP